MIQKTAMTISPVGVVHLKRSRRARRLSLSLTPSGEVNLTLPRGIPLDAATDFVVRKARWIQEHRTKNTALKKRHEALLAARPPVTRDKARDVLTRRLDHLARAHGFSYARVTVRCQKTRWGSCSARDTISLNEKLIYLPQHLVDYVLIHELVHTRIKGHGEDFWRELGWYVTDVDTCRREMRQYRLAFL